MVRRVLSCVLVLAIMIITAILLHRFVFVVRSVEVTGGDAERIRAACGIEMETSIFSVDCEAIEKNVNATGTFALVSAAKKYPDTIILHVRERSRDAMIFSGESIAVLDSEAAVVEICADVPDRDLVYISGICADKAVPGSAPEIPEDNLASCMAVLPELKASGAIVYVSELNISDANNLRLIARDGTIVLLGSKENAAEKIAWTKAALKDIALRGDGGGVLDASGRNHAVYRK